MTKHELNLIQGSLYCIDRAVPWGSQLKTFKKFPKDWGKNHKTAIDSMNETELLKTASLFINQITNQNESKNSSESRAIIENILK